MESKYTEIIAHQFCRNFTTVRQTLRALREGGVIPGRRHGDISVKHLPVIIIGLRSPTYAAATQYVKTVQALRLNSSVDLPKTAGELLAQIVATIPTSPVLGDLDLDDGVIHITHDRFEMETLHLTGRRSVVRYGADVWIPTTSPVRRVYLNSIRKLALDIGNHP